jgi:hypothetical protein
MKICKITLKLSFLVFYQAENNLMKLGGLLGDVLQKLKKHVMKLDILKILLLKMD